VAVCARREDGFVDPVEEGYDLVVRSNPKPTENRVGRRLFTDELVLWRRPAPVSPEMVMLSQRS
jgi:DNA-binding transcriptional LysR family regulator